ncbi:uncharacterized protein LOC143902416 [Temnothorax americanus]|uniref:uncharacterized protein LOC143902416 n=1 Tax=Temnothorax americanus TaxID=1964332 RepID=UPI004068F609
MPRIFASESEYQGEYATREKERATTLTERRRWRGGGRRLWEKITTRSVASKESNEADNPEERHPERRKGPWKGIRHRRSNLANRRSYVADKLRCCASVRAEISIIGSSPEDSKFVILFCTGTVDI